MSSKKGGGKNSVGHLNQGMADVSLDSNGRKSRNKNGSGIAVNRGGGSSAAAPPPPPRAWGQLPKNSGAGRSTIGEFGRPAGRGNPRRRQQQQTRTKSTKCAKSAPFSINIKGSLFLERKWTGMGNQELVQYFSSYAAARACHSYGPNGHRGQSQLKYELRSYNEVVVPQMKQINEDIQKLAYLKNKVVEEEHKSKALEETCEVMGQKLRETVEENRIVRLSTKLQYEEIKEEMDFQEKFFKEQMDKIRKITEEKEKNFERLLQEERAKARQSDVCSGTYEDKKLRREEVARFIDSQVKGVEEFEEEREKLIGAYEEKKLELKRKYLAEEVELEKDFDATLSQLMEKYAPGAFTTSSS